jgi:hypothetical protein
MILGKTAAMAGTSAVITGAGSYLLKKYQEQ